MSAAMKLFGGGAAKKKGSAFGGLVQKQQKAVAATGETETTATNPSSQPGSTTKGYEPGSSQLPETPQSAAVSGLYSELGLDDYSRNDASAGSASRISSTLGKDVDALSALLDSMYHQERRAGMSRRTEPPTGNGVMPYLDIMTVNSTQYPLASDGDGFGNHTKLLIEPISFPSLRHTGVNSDLLDRVAEENELPKMFYPNGSRKKTLRDSIRGLLKEQPLYGTRSMGDLSLDNLDQTSKHSLSRTRSNLRKSTRSMRKSRSRNSIGSDRMRRTASSSSRQRIGTRSRLRSRETKDILDALHETLHFMDRAVMKA